MRADLMTWVQRLVALVFVASLGALLVAVVMLVRTAEGIPPMPVLAGLIGAAALVMLAGACLALISIAGSVRRSADAVVKLAARGADGALVASRPFSASALREVASGSEGDEMSSDPRPVRPAGRVLVAER